VTIYFMGVDLMTTWPRESSPHGNWPGGNGPQETKSLLTTLIKILKSWCLSQSILLMRTSYRFEYTCQPHYTKPTTRRVLDILDKEQYQR